MNDFSTKCVHVMEFSTKYVCVMNYRTSKVSFHKIEIPKNDINTSRYADEGKYIEDWLNDNTDYNSDCYYMSSSEPIQITVY